MIVIGLFFFLRSLFYGVDVDIDVGNTVSDMNRRLLLS